MDEAPLDQRLSVASDEVSGTSTAALVDVPDGTLLWVYVDKPEPRPAIVLRRTNQGLVQVAYGTKQPHPEIPRRVIVEPASRAGTVLRLSYTTYFFPKSWIFLRSQEQIDRTCGRNPDLLIEVRRLTSIG